MTIADLRRKGMGICLCDLHRPSRAAVWPGRDHSACNVVPECRGELSSHRTQDLSLRRSLSCGRSSQSGSVDQTYWPGLSSRVRDVSDRLGRKIAHIREYFDPRRAAKSMNE